MRLDCEPGVAVEPGLLLDLPARPEIDRCPALCLHGAGSRVLHGLPVSLREAGRAIVIAGYDDALVAVGRTLRELARSSAVLLNATRAGRGLRALLGTADRVVRRRRRPVQTTLAEAGWAGSS